MPVVVEALAGDFELTNSIEIFQLVPKCANGETKLSGDNLLGNTKNYWNF